MNVFIKGTRDPRLFNVTGVTGVMVPLRQCSLTHRSVKGDIGLHTLLLYFNKVHAAYRCKCAAMSLISLGFFYDILPAPKVV